MIPWRNDWPYCSYGQCFTMFHLLTVDETVETQHDAEIENSKNSKNSTYSFGQDMAMDMT